MRFAFLAAFHLLGPLGPGAALAQTCTDYTLQNLADRTLVLPAHASLADGDYSVGVTIDAVAKTCNFTRAGGQLNAADEGCNEHLWGQSVPRDLSLHFSTNPEINLTCKAPATVSRGGIAIDYATMKLAEPGRLANQSIFAFADAHWYPATVEADGKLTFSAPAPSEEIQQKLSTIVFGADRFGVSAQEGGGDGEDGLEDTKFCPYEQFHRLHPNIDLICASADDADRVTLAHQPKRGLLFRPNRSIIVHFRFYGSAGDKVGVELSGTAGFVKLGARDTPAARVDPLQKGQRWVGFQFAPRLPGVAELKFTRNGTDLAKFETLIETTYAGAFRVGVALLGGGAVERAYSAVRAPGSTQPEIVATTGGDVDLELTAGFALYPEAFDGGRSSVSRDSCKLACISPFVAFGILGRDERQDLEVFKAIYLGAEWEVTPNFGISGALVARRVTRLAANLEVGSAVEEGRVPIQKGVDLGWAIVVNLSPDFFRIATKDALDLF